MTGNHPPRWLARVLRRPVRAAAGPVLRAVLAVALALACAWRASAPWPLLLPPLVLAAWFIARRAPADPLHASLAAVADQVLAGALWGLLPPPLAPLAALPAGLLVAAHRRAGPAVAAASAFAAALPAGLASLVFHLRALDPAPAALVHGLFMALGVLLAGRAVRALAERADSEHEQALIRLVIGGVFVAYFGWHAARGVGPEMVFAAVVSGVGVWLGAVLLWTILVRPEHIVPWRRLLGLVLDTGITTVVLARCGELAAPMLGVYLWVTMGNGLRYGVRSLYVAEAFSLVGFVAILVASPYWRQHAMLVLSFALILLALPLYMVTLLRKLNAAIERANEANRAKSRFLANMSHELRTPLHAVIGLADLLMDERIAPEHRRHAERIHASARLLLGMIERILDISKIEAGRLQLYEERFDLYELLHDVETVFANQAQQKGLAFEIHLDPIVPIEWQGDAARLKQILVNLLGNALKFTEKGGVDLTVTLERDAPRRLVFEVQDTGIGIPADRREKIFEPFVQADASVTRRYGGTGLGMSIVRQIVDAMGGVIELQSEEGIGTTFTVRLPLRAVGDGDRAQRELAALTLVAFGRPPAPEDELLDAAGLRIQRLPDVAALRAALAGGRIEPPILALFGVAQAAAAAALPALSSGGRRRLWRAVLLGPGSLDSRPESWRRRGFDWVLTKPLQWPVLCRVAHYIALEQPAAADNVVSLERYYRNRSEHRLRILVAEDTPVNQVLMQSLLGKVGHEVVIAADGEAALDALENNDFDLAILDMNMPGVSGLDIVKLCRFRADLRALPLIVLTADATPETRRVCEEAGADAVLTKPVDNRGLLALIAELAGGRREAVRHAGAGAAVRPLDLGDRDELIDGNVVRQFTDQGMKRAFFRDLLDRFSREGAEQLARAAEAADRGDWHEARSELHRLKGAAACFGAVRLVALCEDAERRLAELEPAARRDLLARLASLLERSCEAVARRLADER
ncbi:MAG: hypothetical protein KatS3mg121_0507 [Gammaproteobacteria bacterium]|nr:MAG: hypothetical protein KatS3mg121_0507 [Gammaproteobacteria bacterium]